VIPAFLAPVLGFLARDGVKFAGVLLLSGAAFGSGWKAQSWRYEARIAALHNGHAQALAQAHAATRAVEQRRIREIDHVQSRAQIQIDTLQADVARAGGTAERLRRELAAVRAAARTPGTAPRDTGAAQRSAGEPDTGPVDLLAGLLERVERDGRAIAGYAQSLRIAGLACEAGFDAVRENTTGDTHAD